MKSKMLLISSLLLLTAGYAAAATATPATTETKPATETVAGQIKLYNETMNPHQIEHPNHLGFNDLHIQAIRHLVPDTHSIHDPKLQTVVHHHCKAYDDGTLVCLMFHSGMKDQDKPIGFEYIIPTAEFNKLPEAEKKDWHYHKTEVARAHATFPDLSQEEAAIILPAVLETYGKVIYFQKPEAKYPLGGSYVVIVQDMPEQE